MTPATSPAVRAYALVKAVLIGFLVWKVLWPSVARAQLRIGEWNFDIVGRVDVAYDSNVDDAYPEELSETLRKDDFYWMPGISLVASPTRLRPTTTLNLGANLSYEDYFNRNDLDTELYNIHLSFNTAAARASFGGSAMVDYSVDGDEDTYRPGGFTRDPSLTYTGDLFFKWSWNRLSVDLAGTYTSERHDYAEYKADNQDEIDLTAMLNLRMLSWFSLYNSYEWDRTEYTEQDNTETTTTIEFGFNGSFTFHWLFMNPTVSYSLGRKAEDTANDAKGAEWEDTNTGAISISDTWQLTKALTLSGGITYDNDVEENEVGTTFNVTLTHRLSAYITHSASAALEPRNTFGSNSDTETYTYTYNIGVHDLLIPHLTMGFNASYEQETPLDDPHAKTEDTTTFTFNAGHSRTLSRRLSRNLNYTYTWENSNFHDNGAKQKHLVLYGFSYRF